MLGSEPFAGKQGPGWARGWASLSCGGGGPDGAGEKVDEGRTCLFLPPAPLCVCPAGWKLLAMLALVLVITVWYSISREERCVGLRVQLLGPQTGGGAAPGGGSMGHGVQRAPGRPLPSAASPRFFQEGRRGAWGQGVGWRPQALAGVFRRLLQGLK